MMKFSEYTIKFLRRLSEACGPVHERMDCALSYLQLYSLDPDNDKRNSANSANILSFRATKICITLQEIANAQSIQSEKICIQSFL